MAHVAAVGEGYPANVRDQLKVRHLADVMRSIKLAVVNKRRSSDLGKTRDRTPAVQRSVWSMNRWAHPALAKVSASTGSPVTKMWAQDSHGSIHCVVLRQMLERWHHEWWYHFVATHKLLVEDIQSLLVGWIVNIVGSLTARHNFRQ